jgi:hypothetical protein
VCVTSQRGCCPSLRAVSIVIDNVLVADPLAARTGVGSLQRAAPPGRLARHDAARARRRSRLSAKAKNPLTLRIIAGQRALLLLAGAVFEPATSGRDRPLRRNLDDPGSPRVYAGDRTVTYGVLWGDTGSWPAVSGRFLAAGQVARKSLDSGFSPLPGRCRRPTSRSRPCCGRRSWPAGSRRGFWRSSGR